MPLVTEPTWQVPAGLPFSASLVDPAGVSAGLGARVEAPVTRAIVSYWRAAVLSGALWTVTLDAPLLPGAYELVWRTNDPEPPMFEAMVPLVVVEGGVVAAGQSVDWPDVDTDLVRPSVEDVAKLLQTRTVDVGGTERGTFDSNTRPTDEQVEEIIDQAVDDTLGELREQIDPVHYRQVARIATLQAALLIEGSFFREQADDAVVRLYQSLHDGALSGLQAKIEQDIAQQNIGEMEPVVWPSSIPRYLA